ncbi:MAG: hypothetical protein V3T83_07485, partial [Acidobacteriota bacterium]
APFRGYRMLAGSPRRTSALPPIAFSKASIDRPPNSGAKLWGIPSRTFTITDLEFSDGELLVAGLSNQEFSSRLYRLPFPFGRQASALPVEVYHTSHGRYETHAPIDRGTDLSKSGQRADGCGRLHLHALSGRAKTQSPQSKKVRPGSNAEEYSSEWEGGFATATPA